MSQSFITPGWIKICGIRDVQAAEAAAVAGVSAFGLNFFAKSTRCIRTTRIATKIVKSTTALRIRPVGLFVNHLHREIEAIAQAGLTAIQLHGDETPQFVAEVQKRHPDWEIIKAFRVSDSLQPVAQFIAECNRRNVRLAGCLLDACVDGSYGGTGTVGPWDFIARAYDRSNWPPLILAGGLTPYNVATAIESVRPDGVDTASGVELSPGVKDTTLIARFVAEAQQAFAKISRS